MFLPTVLALTLCCWTQEPKVGPATVAPATAEVPAESISLVRSELGQALRDLSGVFGLKDIRPFVVIVHEGGAELPAELTSLHHEGSPGFTILSRHEIHLMLREVARHNRGLRTVVMHELSHELLDQACGEHGGRIPRWFHEGMAQVLAGDTYLGVSEEMIVWRAATGKLTPFYELESRFPAGGLELSVAYAQSYSYVNWLDRAYGTQTLLSMARAVDEETTLERAMVRWTGKSTEALHEGWRHHLVHGSGAIWRSTLSEFFPISVVLLLPVLVIAMLRRKRAERAASRKLLQQDIDAAARAASEGEHAEAADVAGNRGVP